MATYIATVATGLEEFGESELVDLGLAVRGRRSGAVLFAGPDFPSPEAIALLTQLNYWLRGFDRVGVLLGEAKVASLDECEALAAASTGVDVIGAEQTFAVRGHRHGEHPFRSVEIAGAVGQGLVNALKAARGTRPRVSLSNPDVTIRCEVVDSSCRIWFDATGDAPLYLRDYRRQLHPASMRPSMAHLLLRFSGWQGGPLLDPMTGIGTLPIEAGLYARGEAPGSRRAAPTALRRWCDSRHIQPPEKGPRLPTPLPLLAVGETLDLRGVEFYEHHVQGAWLNLAAAGPLRGVSIERGDARRLERSITRGAYPLAIVNPPFGRRIGSTANVVGLYRDFALSARRCEVDTVVAIVESGRSMRGALEDAGYNVVRSISVRYGELPAQVILARGAAAC